MNKPTLEHSYPEKLEKGQGESLLQSMMVQSKGPGSKDCHRYTPKL